MICDFTQLPHAGIRSLKPYVPGKSIESLSREKGLTDIIKLASNENPLGCSPLAQQALQHLTSHELATYPSAIEHPIREKLAHRLNIPVEQLMFSNGSDSLFWFLLTIFAQNKNQPVITHQCAFISYAIQAKTQGIPVIQVEINADYSLNMNAIIDACRHHPSMIFFANPNNPTGIPVPDDEIYRLLKAIPEDTIVVLDEAYHEFANPNGNDSTLKLQKQFSNLVITRTFSKIYGLASLRLGYAIAAPEIIELLIRVQPPFTVNHPAMSAAYAALDDQAFIEKILALTASGMQQLTTGLDAQGYRYLPSCCNFVTMDCGLHRAAIYEKLLEKGVIVRPLQGYDMPNHLRVSIGTHDQNERFLKALQSIRANVSSSLEIHDF